MRRDARSEVVATNRLYYQDCYLTEFPAQAEETVEDARKVYLESTAFYPTSGGQPNDLGMLGDQCVVDVVDEGDRIAHVLAGPLAPCAVLRGRVDWQRRYDHMQQHTGQHLLSAVFMNVLKAQTLSFHMGADVSTIELGLKELTEAQIDEVETQANAIVWEARPVNISFENAGSVEGLRKPSERAGELRIVEITGFDRSACGGTHVRSTAELGPIQILRWEKLRGNVRVEFVCGGRALRRAKQEHRILAELSRITSTAIPQIQEYVSSLKDRLAEVEKTQQRLTSDLARREGEAAYSNSPLSPDGLRRSFLEVSAIDDAVRAKSQAFAKLPRAVVLAVGSQPAGVLIACSPDCGINAGALLKEVLAQAGGRGGGSAVLAQGGLPSPEVLKQLRSRLGFEAQ
ncbi:MAG TPA: DHHA1 domain-containing protein [Bryobacteraceae bacterium]|nr:DHHA1 domain-containing protein [Bryobacteraceae bacterium]